MLGIHGCSQKIRKTPLPPFWKAVSIIIHTTTTSTNKTAKAFLFLFVKNLDCQICGVSFHFLLFDVFFMKPFQDW